MFDLSYWSTLKLRQNPDVTHIEKNVCDNIFETLLGIKGKTKDTLKALMDLKDLSYRHELHLDIDGKTKLHASYKFTKDEYQGFYDNIRYVKLSDGLASNISH